MSYIDKCIKNYNFILKKYICSYQKHKIKLCFIVKLKFKVNNILRFNN